jgi:hypothetical protein
MNQIFEFANNHVAAFVTIALVLIASIVFLITKFKLRWEGFKPVFESRKYENVEMESLKAKAKEYEEMIKFIQEPDFLKKTENGEYIGFIVAKKPYVAVWADGNWNTEEYFAHFDRFSRLWENEDEIVIHGKNPNIPSDLQHIIEAKAKELPSLTIFCGNQIHKHLTDYFRDYTNVKVINRG